MDWHRNTSERNLPSPFTYIRLSLSTELAEPGLRFHQTHPVMRGSGGHRKGVSFLRCPAESTIRLDEAIVDQEVDRSLSDWISSGAEFMEYMADVRESTRSGLSTPPPRGKALVLEHTTLLAPRL